MKSFSKDDIARSAASVWCNCYKCDCIVNDLGRICVKPFVTCNKWYDSYRSSLIALDKTDFFDNG